MWCRLLQQCGTVDVRNLKNVLHLQSDIIFVSFLNNCVNPFIYATKFEPVKRKLWQLIFCKEEPRDDGFETRPPRPVALRTAQEHNV